MRSEVATVVELVAGSGIAALLGIAYVIYAGRVLGPAEYADLSAALALIYFFGMLFSPITPTVSRFVASFAARGETASVGGLHRELIGKLNRWFIAGGVIAAVLAIPLQRVLHFRSAATLLVVAVCVTVFVSVSVDRAVVQGLRQFRSYNLNVVLENTIRLAGLLVAVRFHRTAAASLISYVAGLVVANAALRYRLRRRWVDAPPGRASLRDVLRFVGPMTLVMLAFALFQNADMLAAKRWLPADVAGWYGAGVGLTRAFAVIATALFVMIIPRITELHDRGEAIAGTALRLCGYFVALCAIPLIAFAIAAGPIIRVTFGPQYAPAAGLIVPLSLLGIVSNLSLLIAQAMASARKFIVLRVYLPAALLELPLLWIVPKTPHVMIYAVLTLQSTAVGAMIIMLMRSDRVESR